MKKFLTVVIFALTGGVAAAQGYVGVGLGAGRVSMDCPAQNSCANHGPSFQFRAGVPFDAKYVWQLGPVSIGGVEVGYTKFGRVTAFGSVKESYLDGIKSKTRVAPTELSISSNFIYSAMLASWAIDDGIRVVAKVGGGYVSASTLPRQAGISLGGETENHLKPVFGLGLDYQLLDGVKATLSYEATRYQVGAQSGRAAAWLLGANYSY